MHTIRVKGMMCNHCAMKVEKAIKSINGVSDVKVKLEDGTVTISGDFEIEDIEDAILEEGYEVIN